jgi:class 3 adenylate cyclase
MQEGGSADVGLALEEALAGQGPPGSRSRLSEQAVADLAAHRSTPVEATVIVGDLRLSTYLLKESVRPELFARFIVGFTEATRSLVQSREGWFDKFTGDGFIVFWIGGLAPPLLLDTVPGFCQEVRGAASKLVDGLRRNSRNFPAGVGLSLGIDAGPCELVWVGGSLTLVGSPIVGATRMASSASAGETLANVHVGGALERAGESLADARVGVERVTARTKEYPEGQEAYRLVFPQPVLSRSEP